VSSPTLETNEPAPDAAPLAGVTPLAPPARRGVTGLEVARWTWAGLLILVGAASLALNLGLLGPDARRVLAAAWPAGMVVLGLGLIILGDQLLDGDPLPFRVARGRAESGDLLIRSGTADVRLGPAADTDVLLSGQMPAPKCPRVDWHDAQVTARLEPLWGLPGLSRAQWAVALAGHLPWHIWVSSSTGSLDLDLRDLAPASVRVRSVFGDTWLRLPASGGADVDIRLVFGDLTIEVPADLGVKVVLRSGALADVAHDERRFIRMGAHELGTPLYAVAQRRCMLAVWLGAGHLHLK
jgi:hypothetical protein